MSAFDQLFSISTLNMIYDEIQVFIALDIQWHSLSLETKLKRNQWTNQIRVNKRRCITNFGFNKCPKTNLISTLWGNDFWTSTELSEINVIDD